MIADKCPTCGRAKKRSTQANRRYWLLVALCVPFMYNGQRWSKMAWHCYFKDMFIEPRTTQLPSGKKVVRDPESSELDKDEFDAFMTKVEVWCAEHDLYLAEEVA